MREFIEMVELSKIKFEGISDDSGVLPIYRVKGEHTEKFLFDLSDIEKLRDFDPEMAYDEAFGRGHAEGYALGGKNTWDLVKKLLFPETKNGLSENDLHKLFGQDATALSVIGKFTPEEIEKRVKDYEETVKKNYKVGAEVLIYGTADTRKGLILDSSDEVGYWMVLVNTGKVECIGEHNMECTGKHSQVVRNTIEWMAL